MQKVPSITWDVHAGHRGYGKASHFDRGGKCSRSLGNAKRLRATGFEVIEAANPAEAEQVLKSTTVDALLSDLPKLAK